MSEIFKRITLAQCLIIADVHTEITLQKSLFIYLWRVSISQVILLLVKLWKQVTESIEKMYYRDPVSPFFYSTLLTKTQIYTTYIFTSMFWNYLTAILTRLQPLYKLLLRAFLNPSITFNCTLHPQAFIHSKYVKLPLNIFYSSILIFYTQKICFNNLRGITINIVNQSRRKTVITYLHIHTHKI